LRTVRFSGFPEHLKKRPLRSTAERDRDIGGQIGRGGGKGGSGMGLPKGGNPLLEEGGLRTGGSRSPEWFGICRHDGWNGGGLYLERVKKFSGVQNCGIAEWGKHDWNAEKRAAPSCRIYAIKKRRQVRQISHQGKGGQRERGERDCGKGALG